MTSLAVLGSGRPKTPKTLHMWLLVAVDFGNLLARTATTQETWEGKVAVGGMASHRDAQSKTLLIGHYVLVRSRGSTRK